MRFKVGDLLKFKEDSWWTQRDAVVPNSGGAASLGRFILVTDSLESSELFFYGRICGSDSNESHLWTSDQFDMVSAVPAGL
tara:strand:- start:163 stop:405 length:243 start_codon:yes stop_codon:yes gene_type:complete